MNALRDRSGLALGFCLAALFATSSAAEQVAADAHLLEGARHFRAGRYAEALVAFKLAGKLGARADVAWYVAATLVKLDRYEDAIGAFAEAERLAPDARDAVLSYYQALACYGARLYGCADRLLEHVAAQAGPQIKAHAEKLRADIAAVLAGPPPTGAIDWYHERATFARASGRTALELAYLREAIALGQKRADGYRVAEAQKAVQVASSPREGVKAP